MSERRNRRTRSPRVKVCRDIMNQSITPLVPTRDASPQPSTSAVITRPVLAHTKPEVKSKPIGTCLPLPRQSCELEKRERVSSSSNSEDQRNKRVKSSHNLATTLPPRPEYSASAVSPGPMEHPPLPEVIPPPPDPAVAPPLPQLPHSPSTSYGTSATASSTHSPPHVAIVDTSPPEPNQSSRPLSDQRQRRQRTVTTSAPSVAPHTARSSTVSMAQSERLLDAAPSAAATAPGTATGTRRPRRRLRLWQPKRP